MKHLICSLAAVFAASVFAVPTLSNVNVVQSGNRTVTISYELADEPAVVTVDIQTNAVPDAAEGWASIGGENVYPSLAGDYSKVISCDDGAHIITWKPTKSWPNHKFENGTARAVLTAWPTNAPPTYMTVCLTNRTKACYAWYATKDYVPGGISNHIYKTTSFIFRKIPAAGIKWQMGSPSTDTLRVDVEDLHFVTLTEDYYMCCYETTVSQYQYVYENGSCTVNKSTPSAWTEEKSAFKGEEYKELPVEQVGYYHLRGVSGTADWCWPEGGHTVRPKGNPWSGSWLASLRYLTNEKVDLDLPTEAQWEYACRCGTSTSTYQGDVWSGILNNIAWWYNNSQVDGTRQPHPVGRLTPNDWDMYDMIGNVMEWCLDFYQPHLGTASVVNPKGPDDPDDKDSKRARRVLRGGEFRGYYGTTNASNYRSSARQRIDDYYQQDFLGFRLWAPAVAFGQ